MHHAFGLGTNFYDTVRDKPFYLKLCCRFVRYRNVLRSLIKRAKYGYSNYLRQKVPQPNLKVLGFGK